MLAVVVVITHTHRLDDDMSVSYAYGKRAFYNIDSLVELLMSIGMRPIFELR